MAARFRWAEQEVSSRSEQQAAKPGDVSCDFCTGTKRKAVKTCMKCEASYCQTHLEPHRTSARLKSHQLIHPVENLEDRKCAKHDKPLELFCRTDQTLMCLICPISAEHKNHELVSLKEECKGKKAELGKLDAEIRELIQQRRVKVEEIKQSAKFSREAADREKADGVQVFSALKRWVEKNQDDFIRTVEEKQRSSEKQAEGFIKDLQQEISELMQKAAEVEQLCCSEDHLHLLQCFPSISSAPPIKDWTKVRVHQRSYEGHVEKAVVHLEEELRKEVEKLMEAELKRMQQFAVDVTLDPDTAHPSLILSKDRKQVHCGDVRKNLPDNPERFDYCADVLGNQSFSSGRFYFQVEVKGKTEWDLGVVRDSINRKGRITANPQTGFWTVRLRNKKEYSARADPAVCLQARLSESKLEKVGVFVDHEEGVVSFYDVDAAALIYSFIGCSFNEKLCPFFSPSVNYGGKNSAPLIICAVNHSE